MDRMVTLFIKTLSGKSIKIEAYTKETVNAVKAKIFTETGTPIYLQRLIYSGTDLLNQQTLEEVKINDEAEIYLVINTPNFPGYFPQGQSGPPPQGLPGQLPPPPDVNTPAQFVLQIPPNPMMDEHPTKKPIKRRKRGKYTRFACINCRKSHSSCDDTRPCQRCRDMGLSDCRDAPRKRTRRVRRKKKERKVSPEDDFSELTKRLETMAPGEMKIPCLLFSRMQKIRFDVYINIFSYLDKYNMFSVRLTCKKFNSIFYHLKSVDALEMQFIISTQHMINKVPCCMDKKQFIEICNTRLEKLKGVVEMAMQEGRDAGRKKCEACEKRMLEMMKTVDLQTPPQLPARLPKPPELPPPLE